MAVLDRTSLINKIIAKLPDLMRLRSEALREVLGDIIDSFFHRTDDLNELKLREYNSSYNYKTGEGVLYLGKLYQATADTTGPFDPADWQEVPDPNTSGVVQLYDNTATYQPNDLVAYQGNIYECKLTSTGNLPTDNTYWDALGSDAGVQAYDNSATYIADDLVAYQGNIYRAKVGTTGNLPTDANYWELLNTSNEYGSAYVASSFYMDNQVVNYHGQLMQVQGGDLVTTNINAEINQFRWRKLSATPVKMTIRSGEQVDLMPNEQITLHGDLDLQGTLVTHANSLLRIEGGGAVNINGGLLTDNGGQVTQV